jgi:uncharacterized membrane protein YedE/YeeE
MFNFDTPLNLVYGLLTGFVFGFLLQRGAVTRYRVILGQFLWVDHTVLRTMLTAVVVGSVGVYAMHQMWNVPLHLKSATVLANICGGLLFGIGMVVLGYCPGTGVGALGDGSRHAWFGVLGMLVGAAGYAELYPWFKKTVLPVGDFGEVTIPSATHLSPWIFIIALAVIAAIVFALLRGRDLPAQQAPPESPESGA